MERRALQDHGGNRRDAQAAFGLSGLVDFSASINPLGHPEGLQEHLLSRWDEVLHYPDRGCEEFREAACRAYGLPADRLLPGSGSAELFDLALRGLRPRRVLLCPPDFGLYDRLIPEATAVARFPRREAEGFAPDLEALRQAVGPGDAVLFSNPSNPAGSTAGAEELRSLRRRCAEAGAWLFLDEAFADFCPTASILGDAVGGEGLLVFRSLTKFYGIPGLRLGFAAGPPAAIAAMEALQVPWSVNALAQAAGAFCLTRPGWADRTLTAVESGRRQLLEGLARFGGIRPHPSCANYLLVELSPPAPPATALYEGLARRGFLVRHCGSFGLGERYVRVAVRSERENGELLEALSRLLSAPGEEGR